MDYKSIIESLSPQDIINIFKKIGVTRYKETEDYIIFPTICHNEDADAASMKLYYYKNSHLFHCYTECGDSFSIFKLLKRFYETRGISYDWYNDIYSVIGGNNTTVNFGFHTYQPIREQYASYSKDVALPTYNEDILTIYDTYYTAEWLNDGITKEAMDKYHILYSTPQNKIIIPHYNVNGELVGIRGRALNPEEIEMAGKYMPVQIEGKWYSHPLSLNLYGLNMNKENICRTGIAFICESEKAVLQAESFSIPNCVIASCGSSLNKYQIQLLLKNCHPREIVICYDNEEISGDKYYNKLYHFCQLYKAYCNMSFIYDFTHITPLKASPTDCGERTFNELLKKRVKVN